MAYHYTPGITAVVTGLRAHIFFPSRLADLLHCSQLYIFFWK